MYLFVDEEAVLVVQLGVFHGQLALLLDHLRYTVLVRLQDLLENDGLQVRLRYCCSKSLGLQTDIAGFGLLLKVEWVNNDDDFCQRIFEWTTSHLKQNTVKVSFGAGRRIFWPMLIETDRWIEKIENLFIEIL